MISTWQKNIEECFICRNRRIAYIGKLLLTHLRHLLAQLLIITTTYNFFIASGGTTDFLLLITVLHLPSGSGLMLKAVNICCCLTSG